MEGNILLLGLGNLLTINITEFNEVRIGLSESIAKSLPLVHQTVQKILQQMNQGV